LFIAKEVMHWIIGRSVLPSIGLEDNGDSYTSYQNGFQFDMVYSRLIIYAILAILLAVFATYLASQKTRGCQPATFGHLQTLADLVNDWETRRDACGGEIRLCLERLMLTVRRVMLEQVGTGLCLVRYALELDILE
jgi:hypothetical protein